MIPLSHMRDKYYGESRAATSLARLEKRMGAR